MTLGTPIAMMVHNQDCVGSILCWVATSEDIFAFVLMNMYNIYIYIIYIDICCMHTMYALKGRTARYRKTGWSGHIRVSQKGDSLKSQMLGGQCKSH